MMSDSAKIDKGGGASDRFRQEQHERMSAFEAAVQLHDDMLLTRIKELSMLKKENCSMHKRLDVMRRFGVESREGTPSIFAFKVAMCGTQAQRGVGICAFFLYRRPSSVLSDVHYRAWAPAVHVIWLLRIPDPNACSQMT
jgi:hypothetical protein